MVNEQIRVRRARSDDVEAVHEFHNAHAWPFIAPRPVEFLLSLADHGLLFKATSATNLVGLCYVAEDATDDRWEFGGVFVRTDYRGRGLAKRMAVAAISLALFTDIQFSDRPLIAHVHQQNSMPRRLLEALGFRLLPGVIEEAPPEIAHQMQGDEYGKVLGDVYEFNRTHAEGLADMVEQQVAENGPVCIEDKFFYGTPDHLQFLREYARL